MSEHDDTTLAANNNGLPEALADNEIVKTILDLDELLSADVRLAEKTVVVYLKPWLEADIDALDIELEGLVDDMGRPLADEEESLSGGGGRTAQMVAAERQAKEREYAASGRNIRVKQLEPEEWAAFRKKWRTPMADATSEQRTEMWNDLIAQCAIAPTISPEKVVEMRRRLGSTQMERVASACWEVNTQSGVSVPKSLISSRVLKRQERSES